MNTAKFDLSKLDAIVAKTVDAINQSKSELYNIAESARREYKKIEAELSDQKSQVKNLIENLVYLEMKLKESKKKLMIVSKDYKNYSENDIMNAYEEADRLRIEIAVKREQEQYLIKRRNELDFRLKEASIMVEKADKLISHIGVSLEYLTGDLKQVSFHLEDIREKQLIGLRIIKAQEDERQRFAREIHDGPAQSMSNVVLKAEICERLIDEDSQKVKQELKLLKSIVRESLTEVRRIIYNLRPMSLDDLGLVPTLHRYITNCQNEFSMDISFKTRGDYKELRPEVSLAAFRIIQEAINNIQKHANAKSVIIVLETNDDNIGIYISDDGKGFDIDSLKLKKPNMDSGFGLMSIKERVEILEGEFKINSSAGKGTKIIISLPL